MDGLNISQKEFSEILKKICLRDTSADPENWSNDNPLWGHCAVVSLLAQEIYGGELLRISFERAKGIEYLKSHYFNKLSDGMEIDFTIEQFGGTFPGLLTSAEVRTRDHVLISPDTQIRYNLLRNRFKDILDKK